MEPTHFNKKKLKALSRLKMLKSYDMPLASITLTSMVLHLTDLPAANYTLPTVQTEYCNCAMSKKGLKMILTVTSGMRKSVKKEITTK